MRAELTRRAGVVRLRVRTALAPHLRAPKDRLQRLYLPGLKLDTDVDSRTLLVAFGGLRGRIDIPPFEFLGLTGDFPVKRLFVRDLHQAWYHRGIRRHGRTLMEVARSLGEVIAGMEVDRLVTVGNSSGGYAALAFGALLGADTALAFAPQTVLDPDELLAMNDLRWEAQLRKLAEAGRLDPGWVDLGEALRRRANGGTRFEVYFDNSLRVDRLHAERLRGVDGLRLYRFGHSGHYLVNAMRANGTLERVLRRALGAPPRAQDGDPSPPRAHAARS